MNVLSTGSSQPRTIVLIHGLWMTPLSWGAWAERFREQGHTVITPTWPRMEHTIDELRENPALVAGLGIEELFEHHAGIVASLDEPPIIMGHSVGGLITQRLLDRGYGLAGVAIHPGQTKGVYGLPPSQLRAAWPVLKNPANVKRGVPLTAKQFHYGFANALSQADARQAWETFHVPAPGRPVFQAAFGNFMPHAATQVDYKRPDRAPLLLVAGGLDHIVPKSVVKENYRRYKSGTVEYVEYAGRSHFTVGEPGWEQVADESLSWAVAKAR